jgi:hypothetical protein
MVNSMASKLALHVMLSVTLICVQKDFAFFAFPIVT